MPRDVNYDPWRESPPVNFLDMVETELSKAREKHPTPIHNAHEAFGVIYEELDEFWDEVRAQKHDPSKMLKELIQTAAMCYRAAEDLNLIERDANTSHEHVFAGREGGYRCECGVIRRDRDDRPPRG